MEIKEIRRQRLKEWFGTRSIPEKEKSYLSQLMGGKASFGEKAARRLEESYVMPAGLLDTPFDTPPNIDKLSSDWPFRTIKRQRFEKMPVDEKQRIEETLEVMISTWEMRQAKQTQIKSA